MGNLCGGLCPLQVALRDGSLGVRRLQIRLRFREVRLKLGNLQRGKQLPLLHAIPDVDEQVPDVARLFGHDIHLVIGLELGGNGDIVAHVDIDNPCRRNDGYCGRTLRNGTMGAGRQRPNKRGGENDQ